MVVLSIAQSIDTTTGLIGLYTFDTLPKAQRAIETLYDNSPYKNNLSGVLVTGFPIIVDSVFCPFYYDTTHKVSLKMLKYGGYGSRSSYSSSTFKGFDTVGTSSFSISFWFLFTVEQDTLVNDTSTEALFEIVGSGSPSSSILIGTHSVYNNPNRVIQVIIGTPTGQVEDSVVMAKQSSSFLLHHFALTWDAVKDTGSLCVDNTYKPLLVLPPKTGELTVLLQYPQVFLGSARDNFCYHGYFADVKIYNRALTKQEVLSYLPSTHVIAKNGVAAFPVQQARSAKAGTFDFLGREVKSKYIVNGSYIVGNHPLLLLNK